MEECAERERVGQATRGGTTQAPGRRAVLGKRDEDVQQSRERSEPFATQGNRGRRNRAHQSLPRECTKAYERNRSLGTSLVGFKGIGAGRTMDQLLEAQSWL